MLARMPVAVLVRDLTKSYDTIEAVRGVDLEVAEGEVFALLGPNGAGKTTTVEILEGHRHKTTGDVTVLGFDPARGGTPFRERIGIVLQETGVEPYLTVSEVLEMYAGYYPKARNIQEVIEVVGLTEKQAERVNRLSGGQQRRLDVAVGLIGDPDLLFLDEPTTGFDPSARRNAWEMIKNLQDLGKTIFLTTHYMDEAQHLADRVAIIVGGRIVAEGPPRALAAQAKHTTIRFGLPEDGPALPEALVASATHRERRFEITTEEPEKVLYELTRWALHSSTKLEDLSTNRPSLEDVYLELTAGATPTEGPPSVGTARRRRGRR
jgi:ABC-2 type transport system ATP-binding protein